MRFGLVPETQDRIGFNGFWLLAVTVEVCFEDCAARLENVLGVAAQAGNEADMNEVPATLESKLTGFS